MTVWNKSLNFAIESTIRRYVGICRQSHSKGNKTEAFNTDMFSTLKIERFRGIKYARIDNLRKINLFFGKNNCGKSSLLDAVFLIAGLSNPKLPLNVNILRNYRKLDKSDMLLDFYALDASQPISIIAWNDEKRELDISLVESSETKVDLLSDENKIASTDTDNRYGLALKGYINGISCESAIVLSKKSETELEQQINLDRNYKEVLSCRYLTPKYDFYTSIAGLVHVIKNKDEQFILDALRLIEPNLKDMVLSQDEVLVDIGYDKRIPINMMGDGARKVLSMLTTLYECRNGIVLIDEISNGFHYSVMRELWRVIIDAANRNHVQVYATTHDIDSIKGLRDAALLTDENTVACFKLQKTHESELRAYHYSLESVDYSLNQEIEIR